MSDEVLVSKKDLVSIIDALNRFTDDQNSVLLNDSVTVSKQDLVGIIDTLKLYAVDQSSPVPSALVAEFESSKIFAAPVLSKRDYFILCAPREQQPWFKPVLEPRPAVYLPDPTKELSPEEQVEWEFGDGLGEKINDFDMRYQAAKKAIDTWEHNQLKDRSIQWPIAWADAMLKKLDSQ